MSINGTSNDLPLNVTSPMAPSVKLTDVFEDGALSAEAGKEVLTDAKRSAFEPPEADEKRVGARSAGKPGGFQVEEQHAVERRSA